MKRWLAGALLVTVGWLTTPGAVPVYDGVGQPDEPYRYVGKDPAPSGASAIVPVTGGASGQVRLQSQESGPQVLLDLAPGAFTSPGTSITVTATPLDDDSLPPRGELDGNIYRITVTPGAVFRPEAAQGFVFLRAAVMTSPAPVIVYRATAADPWQEQKTTVNGRDNLGTPFRKVGDYSAVRLPGATPLSDGGGLSTTRVVLLIGGVVLLVGITVLVLRRPRLEEDEAPLS